MFLSKSQTGFAAIDTHVDDRTGIFSSKEVESRIKSRIYKIKEKDTPKPFKNSHHKGHSPGYPQTNAI